MEHSEQKERVNSGKVSPDPQAPSKLRHAPHICVYAYKHNGINNMQQKLWKLAINTNMHFPIKANLCI